MGMSDVAAGLRALFGDPDKLSSGLTFDAASYERAKPLFIAGMRNFAAAGRDVAAMADALVKDFGFDRATLVNMTPYLRRFIEDVEAGAIQLEADEGVSDSTSLAEPEAAAAAPETLQNTEPRRIAEAFAVAFARGRRFASITEARAFAAETLGRKLGEPELKMVEEAIEAGVVLRAREIVGQGRPAPETYAAMTALYAAQPGLRTRTSTSVEQQAYSTPAPLAYAISMGIIEHNIAHGVRKPKDQVRDRRLSEDEYRLLGNMLRKAGEDPELAPTVAITRLLALTGCRRGEIISLKWSEVDFENSCLRLADSKEGASTRPIGLPVVELLEERRKVVAGEYVFPGTRGSETFGSFPNQWQRIFDGTELPGFTAHILRHSFASTANDLGFTESTIAALVGHATGSITSKYIHSLDSVLIMAADSVSGYIHGMLAGVEFTRTAYALDRTSRREALSRFIARSSAAIARPTLAGHQTV